MNRDAILVQTEIEISAADPAAAETLKARLADYAVRCSTIMERFHVTELDLRERIGRRAAREALEAKESARREAAFAKLPARERALVTAARLRVTMEATPTSTPEIQRQTQALIDGHVKRFSLKSEELERQVSIEKAAYKVDSIQPAGWLPRKV